MKVDLYYDPVRPTTTVCIDGRSVDRHDVYGFLYPVRHCILQTYLPASSSWSGLRCQLSELARGERVTLAFHGRSIDYEDVRAELGNDVSFKQDELIEDYRKMLDEAEQDMQNIFTMELEVSSAPVEVRLKGSDLFQEEAEKMKLLFTLKEKPWLLTIDSEEAFDSARREDSCCLVKEPFLSGFAAIDRLSQLIGSMLRSRDMICCAVDSAEKLSELSAYAKQFPGLSVRFVDENENSWLEALDAKYGVPFRLRQRLMRTDEGLAVLEQCYQSERLLSKKHSALRRAVENGETLKVMQRNRLAYQLRWLQEQRHAFERLKENLHEDFFVRSEGRQ